MIKQLTSPLMSPVTSPRTVVKRPLMQKSKLFTSIKSSSNASVNQSINATQKKKNIISSDGTLVERNQPFMKKCRSSKNFNLPGKITKNSLKELHIDSFNTADSTQKICLFSSNNNSIRSLSTSTSRKKLVSTYMKSVTKESSMIKFAQLNEAKKEFGNNIMLLENWINKIKVKGFHNNMNRILYKQSTITRLEDSIKFLEESLNKIRRTNSQVFVSKGKAQNENDKVKEKYEKVDREKGKYVDDIIRIKKEISTIPLETQNYKMETIRYGEEYVKVQDEICGINEEIQNMNLKITEVKKEKERILASKTLIEKAIFSVKEKIYDKMKRSTNFMLSVNALVSEEGLFENK